MDRLESLGPRALPSAELKLFHPCSSQQ